MENIYPEAGSRIRKLRESHCLTREELAEKAEISPKFLYEIEKGVKGFSADTLYRLSRALSVNCEFILAGEYTHDFNNNLLVALNLYSSTQMDDIVKILETIHNLSIKN